MPIWMRACLWIGLIAFEISLLGIQLSNFSQLSKPGNELYIFASTALAVVIAIVLAVLGLQELKRAGQATGKHGFLRQMSHILLRTFLFVLLPCIIITLLLIAWAILTHQPAFRTI